MNELTVKTAKAEAREYPILFSSAMIPPILADRKLVTRRMSRQWLKVRKGDRLWVRETWQCTENELPLLPLDLSLWAYWQRRVRYRATDGEYDVCNPKPWKPSIHMPRWASRITLEATEDARLERLQEITEEDAVREGVEFRHGGGCFGNIVTYRNYAPIAERACDWYVNPISSFRSLWLTLHTKPGERWQDDPKVVRLAFRRIA